MKFPKIQKQPNPPPTRKELNTFYGLGFDFLQRNIEMQKLQLVAQEYFAEEWQNSQDDYHEIERCQQVMAKVIRLLLGNETKAAPSSITDKQRSLLNWYEFFAKSLIFGPNKRDFIIEVHARQQQIDQTISKNMKHHSSERSFILRASRDTHFMDHTGLKLLDNKGDIFEKEQENENCLLLVDFSRGSVILREEFDALLRSYNARNSTRNRKLTQAPRFNKWKELLSDEVNTSWLLAQKGRLGDGELYKINLAHDKDSLIKAFNQTLKIRVTPRVAAKITPFNAHSLSGWVCPTGDVSPSLEGIQRSLIVFDKTKDKKSPSEYIKELYDYRLSSEDRYSKYSDDLRRGPKMIANLVFGLFPGKLDIK